MRVRIFGRRLHTRDLRPPPKVFYGWWIVGAGGLVQGYASGVFWQGFGAFFTPIIDTFGWSRGGTALALSFN
ncbi:MAG: hypothetical protein QF467_03095, partial [SAR202 cluster bacterium]|nr:hypothetical protein [SAR202 cluster bacterium]